MSTQIERHEADQIADWIDDDKAKKQIAAAVGEVMDPEQFTAHMMVAFQNPDVQKCTTRSKAAALMKCAALGLLPTLGQVALIPYEIKNSGTFALTAMPQWQGLKAVIERHKVVLEVEGVLVHPSDKFDCSPSAGIVNHASDPFDPDRKFEKLEDIRGGYCKITYLDGRPPRYHFVTQEAIRKARACAKTLKWWNAWFYQMALKTLYRDCYARRAVPVDPVANAQLERIIRADDVNMGNDPLRLAPPAEPTVADLLNGRDVPAVGDQSDQLAAGLLDTALVDAQAEEFCQAFEQATDQIAVDRLCTRASEDDLLKSSPAAMSRVMNAAAIAAERVK